MSQQQAASEDLLSLISKEKAIDETLITLLEAPRHEAVLWISTVSAFHGFSALTTVLAVNYFDRFVTTSLSFKKEKPWMTQLVAVACLSLAAKMEEIKVPLLYDLQVEESKFVFEAKTIQRMELFVLSTLQWRMNPVTSICFFQYVIKRLGFNLNNNNNNNGLHLEFLCRCEQVLLSVIADSRVMSFLPSTLAAATMMHVMQEIEPFGALQYRNQLLRLLKTSEEQVNECYKLMLKLLVWNEGISNLGQKRKCISELSSPGGVIDAYFSCESSNDSWTMGSAVSVSMWPVFKRSKT